MTFLEAVFACEPPIGEHVMKALDDVRDVYGIRRMKFNPEINSVTIAAIIGKNLTGTQRGEL